MLGLTPFNNRQLEKRDGRVLSDFYNVMDSFFDDSIWPSRDLLSDTFKIDVKEKEDYYLIEADLPGVEKEDVKLDINKDVLSIYLEKKDEKDIEEENYIHRERKCTSMMRSVQLRDVDEETIEAKLKNGVLMVKAQKMKEERRQKYIEIK